MISLGTPLVALQDRNDFWVDFKIPTSSRLPTSVRS